MIGNAGKPGGAEKDGIFIFKLPQSIFGHHSACLRVMLAAPVKRLPVKGNAMVSGNGFEDFYPFGDYFLTDSISWNDSNIENTHESSP